NSKPIVKKPSTEEVRKKNKEHIAKLNSEVFEDNKALGKRRFVYIPSDEFEGFKQANPSDQSDLIEKYTVNINKISTEGGIYKKEYNTPLTHDQKEKFIIDLQKDLSLPGNYSEPGSADEENNGEDYDSLITAEPPIDPEIDFGAYVKRLINSLNSPEQLLKDIDDKHNVFAANQRPDGSAINENIKALEFKGGPADVPAFYDFNSLQIAFPHIWQELIDSDSIELSEQLLKDIDDKHNVFAANQRPDGSAINENIKALEFKGGPADVPAFYDFNSLQIAFPHIWQELIDSDSIELSEQLLQQLAEDGVDISDITDEDDIEVKLSDKVRLVEQVAKINLRYSKLNINRSGYNELDNSIIGTSSSTPPPKQPLTESGYLLNDLKNAINEKSKFTIFKEGHINFGIIVTYRQKWVPLNYQVGDLVRSIPLSPKEVRKVSIKKVVKKDNVTKSMENNLRSSQEEENVTERLEKEIVKKAQKGNSFGASASFSRWGVTANSDFKSDSSNSSDAVKKEFRESVKKAAQEYKDERKIEIETKETYESEYNESSEISNPNDELTVTYLFYELQRRFEVSEKLHKVTPIVLVPMPMPTPSRKDMNTLILKYGWVINRVLLDDRFRAALEYVMNGLIGEEAAIEELKLNQKAIRKNIESLGNLILKAQNEVVEAEETFEDDFDAIDDVKRRKLIERNKFIAEMAKDRMEQAIQHEQKLMEQMSAEQNALLKATNELNQVITIYESKLFEINLLRLHIKENIFYYMQSIWDYTHKDNIFMTLYDDKVPVINSKKKLYTVLDLNPQEIPPSVIPLPNKNIIEIEVKFDMDIPQDSEMQTLIEVADLDKPLGFKGNYMMFPMKRPNAITEYMMTPYLDEELGLRDPDGWGQWTPDEYVEFFHHLKQIKTKEEFEQMQPELTAQYGRILDASRRLTEEIIVPTDSLYIEALPGNHPLLEDFKLKHRIMDVQKVQAEVRKLELENLRYANRILDKQLDDPETEKKVIVGEGINAHIN
ncbi:MAG TPA: hypothetical protein PLZ32_04565, partial [Saprospiraceae bacterium]|nr:hypothetical protein [Saprospiraceae bacterium]